MTPRHRRLGVLVGIALLVPMLTAPASWADPLADKKAEAARLQADLDRQGNQVSILAEKANRARIAVARVEGSLAQTQSDVSRSDDRLQVVRGRLAAAAVLAYVNGGSTSMIGRLARGGKDDMIVRTQYLKVTSDDQLQVIGDVKAAKEDLLAQKTRLESDQKAAAASARVAASASAAAAGAENAQRAVLSHVTGEIGDLVAADQARAEAEAARARPAPVDAPAVGPGPTPVPGTGVTEPPRIPTTTVPPAGSSPQAKAAPAAAQLVAPPASGKAAIAVAEARKQLGKDYVYGAAGPDNFDCSGLTAWAWKAAGVSLSHSAYDQWFETTRVPVNAVQPGDLLFFGDNGVESIHHNAIYIGDGNMIEASQTGTPVRIRGWRSADLVGAGRPG
ncbi:MAG: NlpC/P60 family protein [Actinomycetota bacterium]|nr:NlpC/P60 family protein [Actinomycetota bacterium]